MFTVSRFGALIQLLSRDRVQQAVNKYDGDRYVKRFGCWDQLLAMVYAHLDSAESLRTLQTGLNQHSNHHYHLGTREVSRSTLADANRTRNPEIFAQVVRMLVQQAGRLVSKQREEMLFLLDSTSIALRGRGSQWTQASATRTPGLKMHILYASHRQMPVHHSITQANVNDVDEGREMPIVPGATYVFDKGYCDYAWWARIAAQRAKFVTRLKKNAAVRVEHSNEVLPEDAQTILSDQTVKFTYRSNRGKHRNLYEGDLRRIEVARMDDEPLVLITNDLTAPAREIAQLYKQRWGIELFFKWIKQHLRIKRFLGESENAVRIQLLTALIAYLLVVIHHHSTASTQTLWQLLVEIRTGLFQRAKTEETITRKRKKQQAIHTALQPPLFT